MEYVVELHSGNCLVIGTGASLVVVMAGLQQNF